MLSTVVEVCGFVLLVAAAFVSFGWGAALFTAGAACLVVGFLAASDAPKG